MGMDKWTLWHIGLSVKNLDQAVEYYKSLGGKADDAPGHILDSANFKNFRTYGKSTAPPWKIKIKMVQLGPLMLELTEPVEGGNYNETYMDQHGEGVNHAAYQVDDLETEVKELEGKGVPVMYHAKGIYAYLDTRKVGGMVIELFQKRDRPATG
jgi:methylmalonyl-CoA/ethylmalonyl-CoA epimerase